MLLVHGLEVGGMTFQRTHEDHKRHARQKDKVLSHLQTGAPLTQDQARELYGGIGLASRMSELREDGCLLLSLRHETGVAGYLLLEGGRE